MERTKLFPHCPFWWVWVDFLCAGVAAHPFASLPGGGMKLPCKAENQQLTNTTNQDDHKRGKKHFSFHVPSDSFCPSPVQQHLFPEQAEGTPQVTVMEWQAGKAELCAPAWRSRPRGGDGAAPAPAALLEGGVEGPADDEPAHLAGAGPDLVELGVAQEAPHGVVVDVTVPACHTEKATSHSRSLISELRVGKQGEMFLHCAWLCPPVSDSPRHWIPSRATCVAHSAEYRITPAQSYGTVTMGQSGKVSPAHLQSLCRPHTAFNLQTPAKDPELLDHKAQGQGAPAVFLLL